ALLAASHRGIGRRQGLKFDPALPELSLPHRGRDGEREARARVGALNSLSHRCLLASHQRLAFTPPRLTPAWGPPLTREGCISYSRSLRLSSTRSITSGNWKTTRIEV